MPQKTVTEKDQFLQRFEIESQTTLKLLKAFPTDKADFKPHPILRSARDLAWVFTIEQGMADHAIKGRLDFSQAPPTAPANFNDVIKSFEQASRETIEKTSKASEDDLHRTVQFPTGPGKMGDFRAIDILWLTLMDQIHHRGQFSIYLRLTGAKVPSIYGPSADEPWM